MIGRRKECRDMSEKQQRHTKRFSASIEPELLAAARERAKSLGFERYQFSRFVCWLIKRDLRDRPALVFDEKGTYTAPAKKK
jgi:hypothetical protein